MAAVASEMDSHAIEEVRGPWAMGMASRSDSKASVTGGAGLGKRDREPQGRSSSEWSRTSTAK